MKNKQFFILILLLVIGFASISATLIINGNTNVAANLDDFNVIFIEGFLNGETNEDIVISGDKKTLTFTTNILTNINDTARVDYKVKNISTQYDGDVTINCTNAANDYVSVSSSFDGKNLPLTELVNMQAQEVKSGYIYAELTKATTEDQEVKITCKIEVSATSRTNYAYSLSFDSNGGSNVEDKIVEYNSNYGELSVPEKEGYTFIGWFNENDVKVDENTILSTKGNKTLTAKWAETAYPIEIKKVYSDKTETETINIPYGESIDTLLTVGEEYFISNIECNNGYTIENYNKEELIFGEQTIRINNNHIANSSTCTITVIQGIFKYSFTGAEQNFITPISGNYKIELWGARGGHDYRDAGGSYVSGNISLNRDESFFVYVGKSGHITSEFDFVFNYGYQNYIGDGGGATDIRLTNGSWNSLSSLTSRIMVAGGGGGSGGLNGLIDGGNPYGGSAGGLVAYQGGTCISNKITSYAGAKGATQTTGHAFGQVLATHSSSNPDSRFNAPGGNGYWSGNYYNWTAIKHSGVSGAGGGSSFISGHNGCVAVASSTSTTPRKNSSGATCADGTSDIVCSYHYSGIIFSDTIMVDGAGYKWTNVKGSYTGMPTHDGTSTMTGNTGDGYAKITYLGK